MAKYVITGGAGFIGSHTAEKLAEQGHNVKIIDNLSSGSLENIKDMKVEFVKGDICDLEFLKKEFVNMDYIIHLAAMISVPETVEDPKKAMKVNVDGTFNVLLAAKANEVKRVVLASSAAVYGNNDEKKKKETIATEALSPYATTKITGEKLCEAFYHSYGLETVSLRFFNVFGPRQRPDSAYAAVIPKFIDTILQNKQPTIFGDGLQTRDFVYVGNVADALILATTKDKVAGEAFNIASGKAMDLKTLMITINKILGTDIQPLYQETRAGDIKHSLADVSKAQEQLGYTPAIDFEEGLGTTIAYMKEQI